MTIDLNETVKELRVQKRRIYDITNVLEGIIHEIIIFININKLIINIINKKRNKMNVLNVNE